jgi:putative ABC transport system permease protein
MHFTDVFYTAIAEILANKLRSFFTLLGIIVSVAFLVAVVAVIQGMNSYVKNNIANSVIGTNAFQVRRVPIQLGFFDDEMWKKVARRPILTRADFEVVRAALPNAQAVAITSGAPSPLSDVQWGNRVIGDVTIRGITAPYQEVQDYHAERGRPLIDLDETQRRAVVVIGSEVAEKMFEAANPIGQELKLAGERFEVVGVLASKGRVLGRDRVDPAVALRDDLRSPRVDFDLDQDGGSRRCRSGHGARRRGDAHASSPAARPGEQLLGGDGRGAR